MSAATKVLLTDLASSVNHVPSNYVRPISDQPNFSDVQSSDASIPLIDLQGLHGPNHSNIIKQIGQACQQDGFFQIKNHGIPETLISTIMNIAREFSRLPESERMKSYSDDPTKTTRLSTSFNVKTEKVSNWRDFLRLHRYPLEDYVNEWPSNLPSFREDVAEYCTSVRGLMPRLLEAISESLGLERDCIEKALGKQGEHMEGVIVEIPEIVLAEIRANPTRTMGWFGTRFKEAWKDIYPLTERSVKEGWLPFSDSAWTEATNPWWCFLADVPYSATALHQYDECPTHSHRAREITDLLPFDRAIHTNTIGYFGGLWILWNADTVDISFAR